MDLTLVLSVAVFLVGVLLYLLAASPKVVEVGRIMFFAGLLAALLRFAGHAALRVGE